VNEELEAAVMHLAQLGEGRHLTHEARKPLTQGIDLTLNVASLALLLADGFVSLFGNHPLVGFPQVL
jgi:hypothetical protein